MASPIHLVFGDLDFMYNSHNCGSDKPRTTYKPDISPSYTYTAAVGTKNHKKQAFIYQGGKPVDYILSIFQICNTRCHLFKRMNLA